MSLIVQSGQVITSAEIVCVEKDSSLGGGKVHFPGLQQAVCQFKPETSFCSDSRFIYELILQLQVKSCGL